MAARILPAPSDCARANERMCLWWKDAELFSLSSVRRRTESGCSPNQTEVADAESLCSEAAGDLASEFCTENLASVCSKNGGATTVLRLVPALAMLPLVRPSAQRRYRQ